MNRTLLFLLLLLGMGRLSYAQCQSSVKVTQAKALRNSDLGVIEIRVESRGGFSGKLVAFKGIEEFTVKDFSGTGGKNLLFDNLKRDVVYRVVVSFDGESEFLCRKKHTGDILLTDSK